ncbi:putative bifunctional diguanylate cyclase/phosphodiesterase [Oceanisphaera pacifica]|uniref:EAL domain-containing protein n=1 Tax=Oceanisphaera pacifica TaxID=2818389 RepID=A0ABS3NH99_9GAMM|nr:EAL domain-containing protein [Oceanisphaera pacifica]MBO1519660.1 EAL domain-containing protein [Oceanisphaera pacifica]
MIIQFVEHSALLLALCWLMTLNIRRWERNNSVAKVISGVIFGLTCAIGMMIAVTFDNGWVFDARSVVLSIAAFVSGPLVAVIAGIIAASYRLWLGGAGMTGGLVVIGGSILFGLLYRHLYQHNKVGNGLISLFCFGLLVHLSLLGHFLLLPAAGEIAVQAGIAMLLVMPLTTVCLGWMLEDIKRRHHNERELQISATAFEVRQVMIVADKDRRILRVNRTFTTVTGYEAEEVVGKSTSIFHSGRHDAAFYEQMQQQLAAAGRWQGEIWNRRKSGDVYPAWLSMSAVRNAQGKITHYVSSMEDISERKAAEARIHHLASFDELTGLPNRSLLFDRVQQAINFTENNKRYACLLFIDLDGFKSINDLYGHETGDQVLLEVARRLSRVLYSNDTLARLGADEFVIMTENLSVSHEPALMRAEQYAMRVNQLLSQPYQVADNKLYSSASIGVVLFKDASSASIGVVLFKDASSSSNELIQHAEIAMHQAKASGKQSIRCFDPAMQEEVNARLLLEDDIRRGLQAQEFIPYFQPQLNELGQVTGAEVLARWQHAERGLLTPNYFISVAEQAELIEQIDLQMLRQACLQLALWQQTSTTSSLRLAVNLSARLLYRTDFVEMILQFLAESGADPRQLKLELTETMLFDDMTTAIARMQELKKLGIRFSIDDFGTGYSSLAYLQKLPLNQLKIDQSFVRALLIEDSSEAIIKAICALADSLDLEVIAEGVETQAQYQKLLSLDCLHFQGYLFGRPMPLAEFESWLSQQPSSSS